jgi:hypothetical protein
LRATGSGYEKLKGLDLDVLYQGLKSHGVAILTSMIIGFPFQDRSQVMEDFRKLMEPGPVSAKERLFGWATAPLSTWAWLTEKMSLFQQPRLLRIEQRMNI